MKSHHFCCFLFIRCESQGSAHIQGENVTQGRGILGSGDQKGAF